MCHDPGPGGSKRRSVMVSTELMGHLSVGVEAAGAAGPGLACEPGGVVGSIHPPLSRPPCEPAGRDSTPTRRTPGRELHPRPEAQHHYAMARGRVELPTPHFDTAFQMP